MAGQMGGANDSGSFELDLAPLLSIIMKLVPALIVSSVFLQINTVETDIPQAVKEAISQPDPNPKATLQLSISKKTGLKLTVAKEGKQNSHDLPLKEGKFDLSGLDGVLVSVKKDNPEVFRIEFEPEGDVSYQEIVQLMDEARRTKDRKITFPVFDKRNNKNIQTDYMFPDVVFSNVFDG
jgi:biopolymer transport protein ExbD